MKNKRMKNINLIAKGITPKELRKKYSSKNPTKTFIGGLVIGTIIGLAISAVFIDIVILK